MVTWVSLTPVTPEPGSKTPDSRIITAVAVQIKMVSIKGPRPCTKPCHGWLSYLPKAQVPATLLRAKAPDQLEPPNQNGDRVATTLPGSMRTDLSSQRAAFSFIDPSSRNT